MNERNKLITLGVLVVVLLIAVGFTLFDSKSKSKSKKPVASVNAAIEAIKTASSTPSAKDLAGLQGWLSADAVDSGNRRHGGRFGVSLRAESIASVDNPEVVVVEPVKPGDPPRLAGVISVEGTLKAIVDGRAFAVGEAVLTTGYKVKSLDLSSATFEDDQGTVLTIKLMN